MIDGRFGYRDNMSPFSSRIPKTHRDWYSHFFPTPHARSSVDPPSTVQPFSLSEVSSQSVNFVTPESPNTKVAEDEKWEDIGESEV